MGSDLKDDLDFESYYLEEDEEDNGPPLVKKTSRLISAVVNNQVEILKNLLDSPKWYGVQDDWNLSLIDIAIIADKREVFDYMISLPDFLEQHGEKALITALNTFEESPMDEYFAEQLILKGVNVNVVCELGNNALYEAMTRQFVTVSKLLMERGIDVNEEFEGVCPLELVQFIDSDEDRFELVAALLIHGAQPSPNFFSASVLQHFRLEMQEMLFLYTFDSFRQCELAFEVILKLAHDECWMFDEILKYPIKIILSRVGYDYFHMLCSIKIDYLRIIIKRFRSLLREIFQGTNTLFYNLPHKFKRNMNFDNLNLLFESVIRADFITQMNTYRLFNHLLHYDCDENKVTGSYCFVLSYGANISETDLHLVYQHFGFCDLFKILLHMDFQKSHENMPLIPRFFYDPTISSEQLIQSVLSEDKNNTTRKSVCELLHYFSDQRLLNLYNDFEEFRELKKEHMSQLPSLVELARNEFRRYFIKKCDIHSSRKFFTLLNSLPICNAHKKIISYETKLYV